MLHMTEIQHFEYHRVETVEGTSYRRYAADCWERQWGMSWEYEHCCAEIEAAYQKYLKTQTLNLPAVNTDQNFE